MTYPGFHKLVSSTSTNLVLSITNAWLKTINNQRNSNTNNRSNQLNATQQPTSNIQRPIAKWSHYNCLSFLNLKRIFVKTSACIFKVFTPYSKIQTNNIYVLTISILGRGCYWFILIPYWILQGPTIRVTSISAYPNIQIMTQFHLKRSYHFLVMILETQNINQNIQNNPEHRISLFLSPLALMFSASFARSNNKPIR